MTEDEAQPGFTKCLRCGKENRGIVHIKPGLWRFRECGCPAPVQDNPVFLTCPGPKIASRKYIEKKIKGERSMTSTDLE